MPGASSRTTGSATRWNSFQPLFMRHGRVHPFSVTTGLYGRPAAGTSGGWVAALLADAASGTAPIAARLTAAAPMNAALRPRNCLRSVMCRFLLVPRARRGGRSGGGARSNGTPSWRAGEQRRLEVGLGDPEVARGLDRADHGVRLLARIGQQLEDADEHAVVAQQVLFRDRLAQRHDLVAVASRDCPRGAVRGMAFADLRSGALRRIRHASHRLAIERLGARVAGQAPVEDRDFQLDLVAGLAGSLVRGGPLVAEMHHVDEARGARKPEGPRGCFGL